MKKILLLLHPLSIATLSLLLVSIFFRYYLYINSAQLIREFKNQNYREIYSLDALKVSSRLNSLSSAINWVCLEGKINNQVFYKVQKDNCSSGVFKQRHILNIPAANNTVISFTTKLPLEVEYLFTIFFILQVLLIFAIILSTKKIEEYKRQSQILFIKLARNMSHDIRSPLATLNTVLSEVKGISNEEKSLLTQAINRINDISNSLLRNTKRDSFVLNENIPPPKLTSSNLSSLIKSIISDKEIEFSDKKNIKINQNICETEAFSIIDELEFRRIISNLINNSIESRSNEKTSFKLDINLNIIEKNAVIIISDNGKGIPKELLSTIGIHEFTNKKNGNGLGLIHAFESIKNWNGSISIDSIIQNGTTVTIKLPLFEEKKKITLLIDNDELVRLTWELSAKKNKIDFIAICDISKLEEVILNISTESSIYIDSQLDNGFKGEDIAKDLYNRGFKNIFMATGREAEDFKHLKFIKEIRDKATPW